MFKHLRSAGLYLKAKKCMLLRDKVPYLGHVISTQGIKVVAAVALRFLAHVHLLQAFLSSY